MFQVVSPNSSGNATFNEVYSQKIIQPPEKNPSQLHKSAKRVVSSTPDATNLGPGLLSVSN